MSHSLTLRRLRRLAAVFYCSRIDALNLHPHKLVGDLRCFNLSFKYGLLVITYFLPLSTSFYVFLYLFIPSCDDSTEAEMHLSLVGLPGQICMDETTGVIRGCPLMERVAGCSGLSCEGII